MAVAWAALGVSVGQLLVGVLALRSPKGALKVEASNDAEAAAITTSLGSASPGLASVDPTSVLLPIVKHMLIVFGTVAAIFCVILAQRAWKGWSGPSPEALGVALSALMAMAAGVVAIFLIAAM